MSDYASGYAEMKRKSERSLEMMISENPNLLEGKSEMEIFRELKDEYQPAAFLKLDDYLEIYERAKQYAADVHEKSEQAAFTNWLDDTIGEPEISW